MVCTAPLTTQPDTNKRAPQPQLRQGSVASGVQNPPGGGGGGGGNAHQEFVGRVQEAHPSWLKAKTFVAEPGYRQFSHYLVTSDCGRYSDWQAVLSAYSFYRSVEKHGHKKEDWAYTRLITCDIDHETGKGLSKATFYSPFEVSPFGSNHPDKKKRTPDAMNRKHEYLPPLNKPRAINYWLNGKDVLSLPDDYPIVLVDADFVIFDALKPEAHLGKPVAQAWPMGPSFLHNGIAEKHCRGKCADLSDEDTKFYVVGPPYMMSLGDLRKIAPLWEELTVEMLMDAESYKTVEWLADMYGYILASIILDLPHDLRYDWQVTQYGAAGHEFEAYEKSPEYEKGAGHNSKLTPRNLHYCQPYSIKPLNFLKHHFHEREREGLLSCDRKESTGWLYSQMLKGGVKKWNDRQAAEDFDKTELHFTIPSFQEAVDITLEKGQGGQGGEDTRRKFLLGSMVKYMEAAFADFRKKMCVEPMSGL
jgi:hypothetical protein